VARAQAQARLCGELQEVRTELAAAQAQAQTRKLDALEQLGESAHAAGGGLAEVQRAAPVSDAVPLGADEAAEAAELLGAARQRLLSERRQRLAAQEQAAVRGWTARPGRVGRVAQEGTAVMTGWSDEWMVVARVG
jgi:hypothetical protein